MRLALAATAIERYDLVRARTARMGNTLTLPGLLPTSADAAIADADDVVARARRGDRAALGQLYRDHHVAVRAFARRLVGEESAAEDLVHDVFVAVPEALGRYRGDASLRTFLVSIAVNHARHHLRAAQRRRAMLDRFSREREDLAHEPTRPDADLARRRLADRLTRALDELPIEQRVVVVLCEVEERTSTEVAAIVGAPEATVRTRLFHARKKLRASLGMIGEDGEEGAR